MKRKKRSQPSLTESLIRPAHEIAKERGLDPDILEKESLEFGFGVIVSGICNIDIVRYDQWIGEQIRSSGVDIEKPVSQKTLSETTNRGVLNGNITKLSEQLKTDLANLDWLESQISQTPDGLEQKQLRVKMQRLEKKIDNKKTSIKTAEERSHFLYDTELGKPEHTE